MTNAGVPFLVPPCSVTRRLDRFFNIWPSTTTKVSPTASKVARLGSEFLQNFTKEFQFLPKWRMFSKSIHNDAKLNAHSD